MRFPLLSKVLVVGAVMALISLVLLRIDGLVDERRQRQREAQQSVAQSFAGEQTLLGPLLHRSCTEEWAGPAGADGRATLERREFVLTSVPQSLVAASTSVAEARYRGLFKVNGYGAGTTLAAAWPSLAGAAAAAQPRRVAPAVRPRRGDAGAERRARRAQCETADRRHHRAGAGRHCQRPLPARPACRVAGRPPGRRGRTPCG